MRLATSILVSTLLWFLLPLAMEMLNSARTPYGWQIFWRDFPVWAASWLCFLLPVATVMHLLFRSITVSLRGWRFWLFPVVSLPLACVFWWMTCLLWDCVVDGILPWSKPGALSALSYVLAIVLISLVWLSYPLAILNQLLIQWLLNPKQGLLNKS